MKEGFQYVPIEPIKLVQTNHASDSVSQLQHFLYDEGHRRGNTYYFFIDNINEVLKLRIEFSGAELNVIREDIKKEPVILGKIDFIQIESDITNLIKSYDIKSILPHQKLYFGLPQDYQSKKFSINITLDALPVGEFLIKFDVCMHHKISGLKKKVILSKIINK
jgi:hypothetical protein